jgi:ribose transport system substrate-binding protein
MTQNKNFGLILASMVLLGACSDAEEENTTKAVPEQGQEKIQVALVMKTLTNPFFQAMEKGGRQAEQDFDIDLAVKTAAEETSIQQQIDIVEQLVLHGKVSAIVIAPEDSVQLIPALKTAQDKGIKIVNIDKKLDPKFSKKFGLNLVPFISVDNEGAAYLSAKFIADKISNPTEVAILEGIPTAANAQARKAGAVRAFGENKNLKLVASQTAHWKVNEAYTVIASIYADHPDIKAIFCANDMMAMGVLQ